MKVSTVHQSFATLAIPVILIIILFVSISSASTEQNHKDFEKVDINQDGVLNIDEARAVFPDLEINDANNDNIVSLGEIKLAVPDILLAPEISRDDDLPVSATEYNELVAALSSLKRP